MSNNHNDTSYAADENQTSWPAVIVFCKRPHAGSGKQRLAASIGSASALGIAEALLATALGLLAAIPAVIFYNKLSADADRIVAGYEAFADEFSTILSRQLDG